MGNITSPCINICKLDKNNICIGCGRTIEEISNWLKLSNKEKQEVISRLDSKIHGETNV